MDATTETRTSETLTAFLAGLQGGMIGVLWMLGWLGISAKWQQRSFWTAENLLASAFYGDSAIRSGFASTTFSGLALYLLIYSLLGAFFAAVLRDQHPPGRTLLLAIIFALGWYYLSFHLIWKAVMPLVALLHAERATVLGHLVYGTFLGRYPQYLPHPPQPAPVQTLEVTPEQPVEHVPVQTDEQRPETEAAKPETD